MLVAVVLLTYTTLCLHPTTRRCCCAPLFLAVFFLAVLAPGRFDRAFASAAHSSAAQSGLGLGLGGRALVLFEGFRALRSAALCSGEADPGGCRVEDAVAGFAAAYGWGPPGVSRGGLNLLRPVYFSHAAYKAVACDAAAARAPDMFFMANTSELPAGLLPVGTPVTLLGLSTGDAQWRERRQVMAEALSAWAPTAANASEPVFVAPIGVSARDGTDRGAIMRAVGLNLFNWTFGADIAEDLSGTLEHDRVLAAVALGNLQRVSGARGAEKLARLRAPMVEKVASTPVGKKVLEAARQRGLEPVALLREIVWFSLLFGQAAVSDLVHSAIGFVLKDPVRFAPMLRNDAEAFLLEVARLSPPVGGMNPFVVKRGGELQLGNNATLLLSAGDLGQTSAESANRDPGIFREPQSFLPHRSDAGRSVSWNAEFGDICACGRAAVVGACVSAPRACPGVFLSLRLAKKAALFFLQGVERRMRSQTATAQAAHAAPSSGARRPLVAPLEKAKMAAAAVAAAAVSRIPGAAALASGLAAQARAAAEVAAEVALQGLASTAVAGERLSETMSLAMSKGAAYYQLRNGTATARLASLAHARADAAVKGVLLAAALLASPGAAKMGAFTIQDPASAVRLGKRARDAAGSCADEVFGSLLAKGGTGDVAENASKALAARELPAAFSKADFVARARAAAQTSANFFMDGLDDRELSAPGPDVGGRNGTLAVAVVERARAVAADAVEEVLNSTELNSGDDVSTEAVQRASVALQAALQHVLHDSIEIESSVASALKGLTKGAFAGYLHEQAKAGIVALAHLKASATQAAKEAYNSSAVAAAAMTLQTRALANQSAAAAAAAAVAAREKFHEATEIIREEALAVKEKFHEATEIIQEQAHLAKETMQARAHVAKDRIQEGLAAVEHGAEQATALLREGARNASAVAVAALERLRNSSAATTLKVLEGATLAEHVVEDAVVHLSNFTVADLAEEAKAAADKAVHAIVEAAERGTELLYTTSTASDSDRQSEAADLAATERVALETTGKAADLDRQAEGKLASISAYEVKTVDEVTAHRMRYEDAKDTFERQRDEHNEKLKHIASTQEAAQKGVDADLRVIVGSNEL